jgi:hypothetical protein
VKDLEAELLVSYNTIGGNRRPLDLRPECEAPLREREGVTLRKVRCILEKQGTTSCVDDDVNKTTP